MSRGFSDYTEVYSETSGGLGTPRIESESTHCCQVEALEQAIMY